MFVVYATASSLKCNYFRRSDISPVGKFIVHNTAEISEYYLPSSETNNQDPEAALIIEG